MKTTKEILLKAAEVVEQGWTQGELARDEQDGARSTCSAYACKFCMSGAIMRAVGSEQNGNYRRALTAVNLLVQRMGYVSIPVFNDADARTQAEVVATLREAAHECKA